MQLVPAIDLSEGRVVRLAQGDMERKTVYAVDPREVAVAYAAAGAPLIHVVDLDGAFAGGPRNDDAIASICAAANVPVQVGGGIRDLDAIERKLALGAARVVLGTAAVRDEGFLAAALERWGPQVVIGALDAKRGRVALSGWVEEGEEVEAVGLRFRKAGLRTALHTDVSRDGIGAGPNVEASVGLARATGLEVIVSGGVSGMEDIRKVAQCREPGIVGVIVGRALYDGRLDLAAALEVMRTARTGRDACATDVRGPEEGNA